MIIAPIKVEAFRIDDVEGLYPIDVVLIDTGYWAEGIAVACGGQCWMALFGGVDDRSLRRYVADMSEDYLAGCLGHDERNSRLPDIAEAIVAACKELEAKG